MTISPLAAVQAYSQTQTGSTAASGDFGAALQSSINDAIQSGQTADKDATQALINHGDLTQVVTAISHAELTLQTATAIRDRVVQAYQDIMKMPI